jgi:hydroxymethylglutaryl-CoA lyase
MNSSNGIAQSIEIVEVGPRDGLQSESQVLPTTVKVEFVQRLLAAGLERIENASFVNPKRCRRWRTRKPC